MSKADDFRQYADEALRWARKSKDENKRLALLDIAKTWLQAAALKDGVLYINAHSSLVPKIPSISAESL